MRGHDRAQLSDLWIALLHHDAVLRGLRQGTPDGVQLPDRPTDPLVSGPDPQPRSMPEPPLGASRPPAPSSGPVPVPDLTPDAAESLWPAPSPYTPPLYCEQCGRPWPAEAAVCAGCGSPASVASPRGGPGPDPTGEPWPGPPRGPEPPGRPSRSGVPWVRIAVPLAVVVLALGAGAWWAGLVGGSGPAPVARSGSASPSGAAPTSSASGSTAGATSTSGRPSATTSQQAAARAQLVSLAVLLDESAVGRSRVVAVYTQLTATPCPSLDEVAQLTEPTNAVVANRRSLLSRLASTPLDAVPDGAALRAVLRRSWQASLEYDLALQGYQRAPVPTDCRAAATEWTQAAAKPASTAKARFVTAWNRLAVRYGLPTRKATQL